MYLYQQKVAWGVSLLTRNLGDMARNAQTEKNIVSIHDCEVAGGLTIIRVNRISNGLSGLQVCATRHVIVRTIHFHIQKLVNFSQPSADRSKP